MKAIFLLSIENKCVLMMNNSSNSSNNNRLSNIDKEEKKQHHFVNESQIDGKLIAIAVLLT